MPEKTADFWANMLAFMTVAAAWLAGETGKIVVSGGAGGLVRWFAAEKRRLRDGMIAAIGGAVVAYFLWPLTLGLLRWVTGQPFIEPHHAAMAGFITGAFGMSGFKIAIAAVEARARQLGAANG